MPRVVYNIPENAKEEVSTDVTQSPKATKQAKRSRRDVSTKSVAFEN